MFTLTWKLFCQDNLNSFILFSNCEETWRRRNVVYVKLRRIKKKIVKTFSCVKPSGKKFRRFFLKKNKKTFARIIFLSSFSFSESKWKKKQSVRKKAEIKCLFCKKTKNSPEKLCFFFFFSEVFFPLPGLFSLSFTPWG